MKPIAGIFVFSYMNIRTLSRENDKNYKIVDDAMVGHGASFNLEQKEHVVCSNQENLMDNESVKYDKDEAVSFSSNKFNSNNTLVEVVFQTTTLAV